MLTLLISLLLLLISSQTYLSYILFILSMIVVILQILLLGNYYLALIFLMIYIGSIAILFIYILMVLSVINNNASGYLPFLFSTILLLVLGRVIINNNSVLFNILFISKELYTLLLLPIALILFLAMIFAIRSI